MAWITRTPRADRAQHAPYRSRPIRRQLNAAREGHSRSGRIELHIHAPPDGSRDVHQRVQRKARHAPAKQVVLPAIGLDHLSNLAHEICTRPQVCCLLRRVRQRVPDALVGSPTFFMRVLASAPRIDSLQSRCLACPSPCSSSETRATRTPRRAIEPRRRRDRYPNHPRHAGFKRQTLAPAQSTGSQARATRYASFLRAQASSHELERLNAHRHTRRAGDESSADTVCRFWKPRT